MIHSCRSVLLHQPVSWYCFPSHRPRFMPAAVVLLVPDRHLVPWCCCVLPSGARALLCTASHCSGSAVYVYPLLWLCCALSSTAVALSSSALDPFPFTPTKAVCFRPVLWLCCAPPATALALPWTVIHSCRSLLLHHPVPWTRFPLHQPRLCASVWCSGSVVHRQPLLWLCCVHFSTALALLCTVIHCCVSVIQCLGPVSLYTDQGSCLVLHLCKCPAIIQCRVADGHCRSVVWLRRAPSSTALAGAAALALLCTDIDCRGSIVHRHPVLWLCYAPPSGAMVLFPFPPSETRACCCSSASARPTSGAVALRCASVSCSGSAVHRHPLS
jgi:hypothetical protein